MAAGRDHDNGSRVVCVNSLEHKLHIGSDDALLDLIGAEIGQERVVDTRLFCDCIGELYNCRCEHYQSLQMWGRTATGFLWLPAMPQPRQLAFHEGALFGSCDHRQDGINQEHDEILRSTSVKARLSGTFRSDYLGRVVTFCDFAFQTGAVSESVVTA
jgi:hypothetical protein